MEPRIIFMGSPEFALPSLQSLAESYPVVGVITQPDRPAGRGRRLVSPPVKSLAQDLSIPVIQPSRLSLPEALQALHSWRPDLIIVAAFGQILRPEVLDLPPHGCLNVHASLLPRWRGAAPIQAALLHGDSETGVTIMRMDPGVDTGPILSQQPEPIQEGDTPSSLGKRLARRGADLLMATLPGYLRGEIIPQLQDESQATYAPLLKKTDGELDFTRPAAQEARRVRAFDPWPGAFTHWQGERLKVLRARSSQAPSPGPGVRTSLDGLPAIGTSDGLLVLEKVQPAGKRAMHGAAFLAGAREWNQTV